MRFYHKLFLLLPFTPTIVKSESKLPNVIIVYMDDLGTLDANCYGAKDIYTPNIDSLAARGVKFNQFYAAPISSVSRASLLTGQFARRSGLWSNASKKGFTKGKETIAERLKDNGYRTGIIGKWHLGTDDGYRPNQRGFDYFWGFLNGCTDNYSHYFYWNGPNRHDLWENETEIYKPGCFLLDESMTQIDKFIKFKDSKAPFFLYWAANIPHYPLQPDEKWFNYYSNLPNPRRMYAAFISTFDERLGRLLNILKEENIIDNTIIIFQSDNGHSFEVRTFGEGGYCGDYRGGKFSMFEGGIRVPAIISWPGHLPEGEEREQMAMNIDWFPTILDLCNINDDGIDVDGKSLLPIIKEKGSPSQHETLHFDAGGQWAVRYKDWKLIYNALDVYPNDKTIKLEGLHLTNLRIDKSEKENLNEKYPHIVTKLKCLRDEYLKSIK